MTTASLTEIDLRLRDAVMRQLEWDPEFNECHDGRRARDQYISGGRMRTKTHDAFTWNTWSLILLVVILILLMWGFYRG